ncbi:putative drug exporter of the RND superfamily [Nocardioides exalbidus]|uniref:Putative drug exporter of the RND superfamily n=1 Tax=Nocardioides exalbidus TaxID=402596 RepID=A0A1H4QR98_9ACTN|nr:MMPL family transporter [Nocardioides exalbidus]SEC22028.1 putative drug exporter of the RND superfamily [Nocardioides exalbidus]
MNRLTAAVLRHRVIVAVAWLAIAIAGGATASTTVDRLTFDFDLPGQPAYETNQRIVDEFGNGGLTDPLLLVVEGDDAASRADEVAQEVRSAVPGTRTVSPGDDGADVLATDADSAVVVAYAPLTPGPESYAEAQPALEQVAEAASGDGTTVTLTGFSVLEEGGGDDRGLIVEVLIGGIGALVVLALVFGSLLAGLPLLVAAVSILGTFLALLGLTHLTDVSAVVEYLIALIGLGVAIDYSLLVVTRWREESAKGVDNDEAIRAAMATAGRSVVFSGVTVAVSLAALVLVPIPFLRSIGLGGLLIPLFSVAVSLTLVPALLSAVGPRMNWPRRKPAVTRSRLWAAIATGVLRRRWLTVVGSVVVLLALAAPVLGLTLGTAQLSGLANGSAASRALVDAVADGVPAGVVRPTEVLAPEGDAQGAVEQLTGLDGVAAVVAPPGQEWSADGQSLLQVWTDTDPTSDTGRATLQRVRDEADDLGVAVGGTPAEDADFISAVYGKAGWVVLGVAVVTFLLLARALRSFWLPLKALALNALSLAAAYGVTVLIWQDGHGTELLFDRTATGAVTIWVPIAAFAFLFGLSMDYEVFILSRMREEYDALMAASADSTAGAATEREATDRAVVEGIANTGRLVTSAALILFFAFIALSTVPTVEVKVLATALALGIAIDAVIVRGLLAPALVGVLGRANWTIPRVLSRALLLRPSEPRHLGSPGYVDPRHSAGRSSGRRGR